MCIDVLKCGRVVEVEKFSYIKDSQFSTIIEDSLSPTHDGSCVESTTPCASPKSKIIVDLLKSLIVSKGG